MNSEGALPSKTAEHRGTPRTEYLTTKVNIEYVPGGGVITFNGAIAGDSDLDGNGVLDSNQTDSVVKTLKDLKDEGVITGREIGEIIKETRKFSK